MGGGKWEMRGGKWEMENGRWEMGDERWEMGDGGNRGEGWCVCSAVLLTCRYDIVPYHYITVTGWLSSVNVSWRCAM